MVLRHVNPSRHGSPALILANVMVLPYRPVRGQRSAEKKIMQSPFSRYSNPIQSFNKYENGGKFNCKFSRCRHVICIHIDGDGGRQRTNASCQNRWRRLISQSHDEPWQKTQQIVVGLAFVSRQQFAI